MPTINVSSYNAISNINTCLQNYCIPAQTTAIQAAYCTCGRDAGNTAGNTAGTLAGNTNPALGCFSNACFNYANTMNTFRSIASTLYSYSTIQTSYNKRAACCLQTQPWNCTYWSAIPTLNSVTSGLTIWDTSYFTQGISCSWTVPAGATYIRFQVWGAGAGSHAICCCGANMWGGSGAYASVIIPAVPGCVYTLCSGCAYVCAMQEAGINTGSGSSSYVTGYGLCNFCADGGDASQYSWKMRALNCNATFSGQCYAPPNMAYAWDMVIKGSATGCCVCSGGGACMASGAACLPSAVCFTTSCRTWYGCTTIGNNSCHYVIGTPGVFNAVYDPGCGYNSCMCRWFIHPPVTCYTCNCCCMTVNPQYCCPGNIYHACTCCCYGYAPGVGGRPSSVCGGIGNFSGGIGSAGMVCVQYTTTT